MALLIIAEHFGEWEVIVSMMVFLFFCRVSKASQERMESWSVLPRSISVCAPHPHCTSPFISLQQGGLCCCLWRTKNPSWNYSCPKMDVCPGLPVPWGEKRPLFVSPGLFWRDVVLLYPDSCPSEATWHCDSKLLRFTLNKKVFIIHKIREP